MSHHQRISFFFLGSAIASKTILMVAQKILPSHAVVRSVVVAAVIAVLSVFAVVAVIRKLIHRHLCRRQIILTLKKFQKELDHQH